VTLRHLKLFIEVADTGKMSLAAAKYYISQPTVSQAIKELEEYYNVLLFERLSKKLYITKDGKKLLRYARTVVQTFDELEERMFDRKHTHTLRIGATITVANSLITDIAATMAIKSPDTQVNVYTDNTRGIVSRILKSELDIALVEGEVKSLDIVSIPCIEDILVLVCSPIHRFAKMDIIPIEELGNENFIVRELGSGTRELFDSSMAQMKSRVTIGWECNTPEVMKKAVSNNLGVSVMSVRLVREEIENQTLCARLVKDCNWSRQFSVIYHKDKYMTESMRAIMEIIKSIETLESVKSLIKMI